MAKNTGEIYIYIQTRFFFSVKGKIGSLINSLYIKGITIYLLTVKCTLAKHAWKEASITTRNKRKGNFFKTFRNKKKKKKKLGSEEEIVLSYFRRYKNLAADNRD